MKPPSTSRKMYKSTDFRRPNPFVNGANILMSPPQQPQNGMSPQDMFFMMLMNDRLKNNQGSLSDRGSNALRNSIEAQNQILNKLLTTTQNVDEDYEEKAMLRKKIREMEGQDDMIRRRNREDPLDFYQNSPNNYPNQPPESQYDYAPKPSMINQMYN